MAHFLKFHITRLLYCYLHIAMFFNWLTAAKNNEIY